jgi:monoamine oxidase
VWTQFGEALRTPHGRVHWAGTETAPEWNGYMDGAIASGRLAANQATAQLASATTPELSSPGETHATSDRTV